MRPDPASLDGRVVLITGAAQRLGAETGRLLHAQGMDLILHYRRSRAPAEALAGELEQRRPDSVRLVQADLCDLASLPALFKQVAGFRNRLDVLINNASSFYPTPIGEADEAQWEDLIGTNLKAPFFLAQQAAPWLRQHHGCILNLVDIHGRRPLKGHPIYSIAKAGNAMMVQALARELGPEIRVNGVAPGAILWPDQGLDDAAKDAILARTALGRPGTPGDIARALLYLIRDADYVTGQILTVDGGRTIQQ
ncbi:pteridine reductase [Thioalkalicoccus limnaeus]|uniref:Pteridine reductase n=1 Tax=Thioalkalicoccus limnaeus TaxID=120681 RepID=A0ABV4BAN3_9GAMM